MSRTLSMRFRNLPNSQAGLGRVGAKVVIADRPDGVAGGQGLGFNGAELLAAALGGCFWNDLHYSAEARGFSLDEVDVEAQVTLDGQPLRVVAARIGVILTSDDPQGARDCFETARAISTIANSVAAAFPVTFEHHEA